MVKAEQLVEALVERGYTISFAESCTGGKMASAIIDVPDASKVFNSGFITYSNEAKMKYVNVEQETLEKHGAVSEETTREMAVGAAKADNAQVAVGISGIAGPGGGTKEKPVGTVCFGFYMNGEVFSDTVYFGEVGRNKVRDLSVEYVLNVLLQKLKC